MIARLGLAPPRAVARALLSTSSPRVHVFRRAASTSTQQPPRSLVRTTAYVSLLVLSTGLFAVYYFDSRAALHKYVVTPVIRHTLDAEAGHKLAVRVLSSGLAPRDPVPDDEILKVELWGEELTNPIGLAAGFDKHAEAIDGLFDLGFSWVEVGSVTPKPQPGNSRPRVFHLPDDSAVINRYGFPSEGHTAALARLRARLPTLFSYAADPTNQSPLHGQEHASLRPNALLAVNLGKNKASPPESIDDFVAGVHVFGPYADALVVNVSSPNTPGLRGMQSRTVLQELLAGVIAARDEVTALSTHSHRPKLLLKIAPDLSESEVADVAAGVLANEGIDGVIVSNTTIQRPASLSDQNKSETGGLSGPPLKELSLTTLRTLRGLLPASVPLIGCGGISSGADALEFARSGAAAVQLYTAFGYHGPGTARAIKDELAEILRQEGKTWREVVREAVEQHSFREQPKQVPAPASAEPTMEVLQQEAEELKRLIDGFGERMEKSVEGTTLGGDTEVVAITPAPAAS
ncbi:Dihydroorotate dehydrogenase-domain-containing protein [Ganoderma leucocontextum]|nr:Dihydroorotate dehydrogenase-domain-containing protein [Ganoderma leucocontextum]